MQDQYTGDFGDFVKYGLLRALSKDKTLGVAWYLHPDQGGADGNKIGYLSHPDMWQWLDKELFDGIRQIIREWQSGQGLRAVSEVACRKLLCSALFADKYVNANIASVAWRKRREYRKEWFDGVARKLFDSDVIFADPDNGLCLDKRFTGSRRDDPKRLPLAEALQLAKLSKEQTAILYHYSTRYPREMGGHTGEIRLWIKRLPGCAGAFYCNQDGFRTFFVMTRDPEIKDRLAQFGRRWQQAGELIWNDKP